MTYTPTVFSYGLQGVVGAEKGALVGATFGSVAAVIKAVKEKKLSIKEAIKLVGVSALVGAGIGVGSNMAEEHHMRSKVRKLGYDVDKHGNAVFKDKKGKPHLVSLQTKLPKSLSPAAYDVLCNQKYWNDYMDKHPVNGTPTINQFYDR